MCGTYFCQKEKRRKKNCKILIKNVKKRETQRHAENRVANDEDKCDQNEKYPFWWRTWPKTRRVKILILSSHSLSAKWFCECARFDTRTSSELFVGLDRVEFSSTHRCDSWHFRSDICVERLLCAFRMSFTFDRVMRSVRLIRIKK